MIPRPADLEAYVVKATVSKEETSVGEAARDLNSSLKLKLRTARRENKISTKEYRRAIKAIGQ